MEDQQEIHHLIIRLFSGEASADEKRRVTDWVNSSPGNRKLFNDLREIWLSAGIKDNVDEYDVEAAIANFRGRIRNTTTTKVKSLWPMGYWKNVAVILLLVALPMVYYFGRHPQHQQADVIITCAPGDQVNITLPDSTKVWLNSGSRLVFNSDFVHNGRKVQLEGEAYFAVTKDSAHPFRVMATDLEVEVLGTEFNVKAYPVDGFIATTLIEGSVKITTADHKRLIRPNEQLILNKENKEITVTEVSDPMMEVGWKDGRLIFRNESLEELKPRLERWFDVNIVFADEQVKSRHFTGILKQESILEVVKYFNYSNLVECSIEGNNVIIKSEQLKKE